MMELLLRRVWWMVFGALLVAPGVSMADSLMFQANLERTGVYDDIGPEESPDLVWKFDTGAPVIATPLVYEGMVYFVDFEGGVYALSQEDGSIVWEKDLGGYPSFQITVNDDVLLVGRRFSREDDERYLVALDRLTGEEKWRFETNDTSGMMAPTIYEDRVFLVFMSGYIFSLDMSTGEEVWRHHVQGGSGQPLVSEGMIFYQDDFQNLYSLSPESGAVLWMLPSEVERRNSFNTPSVDECCVYLVVNGDHETFLYKVGKEGGGVIERFSLEFRSAASVSLANGVAFFGDDGEGHAGAHGYMNAMDTETGELIWRFETGGFVRGGASIAGDSVYFGSVDENLYAVDRHTGEMRWRYKTEGVVNSAPAIVDGRVYFGSIDGHVYVLE